MARVTNVVHSSKRNAFGRSFGQDDETNVLRLLFPQISKQMPKIMEKLPEIDLSQLESLFNFNELRRCTKA